MGLHGIETTESARDLDCANDCACGFVGGVSALRDQLGYTQEQFASRFGISVATLRHWERGDRRPNGPALVLLNLIARDPQAVGRLLSA
jgi:DNA-binding transcriptional regulator YiaG